MINPKMGTKQPAPLSIAEALFTKSQRQVLAILFGQPEHSFYANEVVRLAGTGSGAIQRELHSLVRSGLVTSHRQGNQVHYQANADSPVFSELRGLVVKTFGVVDVLRLALLPLHDRLRYACVYGSVARGTSHAGSDVDVLLVSADLTLEQVLARLGPAEKQIGRRVNPTLYTPDEFKRRRKAGNAFLTKVLSGERIGLIGSLDGLA